MLTKLKRRFVVLYTLSAGGILAVALVILLSYTKYQERQQQMERFRLQVDQVVYLLQKSVMLNSTEFQTLEAQKHLILNFQENGKQLFYIGNYKSSEVRQQLISTVMERAQEEGVYLNSYPIINTKAKTSVSFIKRKGRESYMGQALIIPTKGGWKSLIVVQDITENGTKLLMEVGLFGITAIATFAGLLLFSRYFVAKTLQPVEESQQKQKEFIAAASHELKAPLAVIRTCASALTISKDKQEEFASDITEECDRMSKLVEELLLLASAEAHSWTLKKEWFALDNFLIEQYEKLALIVAGKEQELQLELPESVNLRIESDKNRLQQILLILLDNASSYSPKKSSIELSLEQGKKTYLIRVADHGIGIADEQKPHLFERFYRAEKSRNTKNHYGLGLSIGAELVNCMGGSIRVSDTKGGGATFTIELPKGTPYNKHRKDQKQ